MDVRIRKYIQYKIRTLNERRKELLELNRKYEELRRQVIDESPACMDGQPRGKGGTSNPTENKVIKLEKIDKRKAVLEDEIKKFAEIEEKIKLMGREPYLIYKHTIADELNPEYVSMEVGMCRTSLFMAKGKIMEFIATELGEYIDLEELEK